MRSPSSKENSQLRFWLLTLVICSIGLALFTVPFFLLDKSSPLSAYLSAGVASTIASFPFQAIAVVIFTFVLTNLYQEIYFDKKNNESLETILFSPETLLTTFSVERVKAILSASMQRLLGDASLSGSLSNVIERSVAHVPQYNVRVNATLSQIDYPKNLADHFFYDLTSFVSYDSLVVSDQLKFSILEGDVEFNSQLNGDDFIYYFRVPKFTIEELNSLLLFEVEQFSIDGEYLPIEVKTTPNSRSSLIVVNIPKKFLDGTRHKISYVMKEKILRRGHMFFHRVRHPTHGLEIILDYTKTDIANLDCIDMMTSERNCSIRRISANGAKQIVVDLQNMWCIPRSGVSFCWSRNSERQADIKAALKMEGGDALKRYID